MIEIRLVSYRGEEVAVDVNGVRPTVFSSPPPFFPFSFFSFVLGIVGFIANGKMDVGLSNFNGYSLTTYAGALAKRLYFEARSTAIRDGSRLLPAIRVGCPKRPF